jgi:phosphoglycolate phosphatase
MTITTVLFDLDGTLVDTAPDLGFALNLQLEKHGKPPLSLAQIRPIASHGSRGLLELGFGITPADAHFEAMKAEYLDLYATVFTRQPVLLAGIEDLLIQLKKQGVLWGIVTNKPRRFSVNLIEAVKLGNSTLGAQSACLLCGDDAPHPKPHPQTLLMACEQLKVKPKNCVYVGDAERDVEAGRAAGIKTVVALFGYIAQTDKPKTWNADFYITQAAELLKLI